MTQLVLTNSKGNSITTSLIVAEIFGKSHDKVMRDIKNMSCSNEFRTANFGEREYDNRGKLYPMFEMTKDGFSFLALGYTGEKAAQFKENFINEFNKREAMLKSDDYILNRAMSIMSDRMKALEQSNQIKDEQLALQEKVIIESAPKVEYFEKVLTSTDTCLTNQIAKELGISAITLNEKLRLKGIQYKQGGQWLLSAKYQGKGLTKTHTYPFMHKDGSTGTQMQTVWTEKGRLFIHQVMQPQLQPV